MGLEPNPGTEGGIADEGILDNGIDRGMGGGEVYSVFGAFEEVDCSIWKSSSMMRERCVSQAFQCDACVVLIKWIGKG